MRSGVVARAVESTAVHAFLERARTEPMVLVVEGEPGIGKSTVLWEAAESAAATDFQVLSTAGAPTEVRYAYAAVADLLGLVDPQVLAGLPQVQRTAVDRVLLGEGDGATGDERMVAAAFLTVIRSLTAVAPVLLSIDDTQWLDASSRAVIGFAARRLTGSVGLLMAVRSGAREPADLTWLNPPSPDALTRLRIAPLTLGGVHALISARLGHTLPRPTITRIHQISGGNPLFALELAQCSVAEPDRADLPDSLAALVRDHIGRPGDDVAAVLLAAASAALPSVEVVSLAAGIDPDRVVELVESEQAAEVVEVDGNRIRFRHPLFATGVYGAARPAQRRAMHRRFAGIVAEPELKARHLALAATTADPDTLKALDAAIDSTRALGAPAVATELIELAIKLGDDTPTRRIGAAEQHLRSGAISRAHTHLQSALGGLPPQGALRCTALIALAAVTGYDNSLVTAAELLGQAIDAADHPRLALQARLLQIPMTGRIGDRKGAADLARTAVTHAEELGIPALRSQALTISALAGFMHGADVDHQRLQEALDLEDSDCDVAAPFQASAVAPLIRGWSGDLEVASDQLHAVYQRFVGRANEIDILWAGYYLGMIDLWLGRFADAAALADDAVQRAEQMGGGHALVHAWANQAAVAAYTGREQDARRAANAALDAGRASGAVFVVGAVSATLAFLEVSRGDYEAALTMLAPQLVSFDPDHDTEIIVGGHLPDAVEALTALGRLDEAELLIAALERNGARLDRTWMLAMGARGRSQVLAARGELDAAEQAAERAMHHHHQRLSMPFEKARTQLFLGQVQRRRRRKQAAEASLRAALQTFEWLGAPLWAQRARAELDRLTAAAPGAGLTAAERRIAERAAAGMSNKQIAAELFIAPKTVEMALSKVYRKLGIRSRSGLLGALNPG